MKWHKLGLIYQCAPIDKYIKTHAANPLAIHLEGDVFRVFFSGRNAENKSSVSYVDIDIVKHKVVAVADKVIMSFGEDGSFYSHGVSIGNAYNIQGNTYILFMGWQIREGEHWKGDIGRVTLKHKKNMRLDPCHVFMACDTTDKVSLSYPWVMHDNGVYKMWYGSTLDWDSDNGEMVHVIKYATSSDGEVWKKHGLAIPYELGVAQAFSRPTVLKDKDGYHMWFSFRSGDGTSYRVGYAHSWDGLKWERESDSGIDVSEQGWDSEMICYPYVFQHKEKVYMLYNGNEYGKEGFGLAVKVD